MNAIQHQVAQTINIPLLRARPATPETTPKHQRLVASETTKRYGPIIEQMRLEGYTYEQIGEKLDIATTSASSFLSRYRTGVRQGKI